jgi:membrane protein implicated in regulation of membrane protease activity
MNQTRLGSLIEALANVVIGFGINWVANMAILPLFGFHVTGAQAFGIGVFFTVISIVRSYVLRRWFNAKLQETAQRMARRVSQ